MEGISKGLNMLNVKLVVVGGATEGDEFQLELPAILGRSRTASVPLPHPLVSRNHCELLEIGQQLYVRDLNSTNGTFVGSERVSDDTVLEHGSLLTIGTVTFRAYLTGAMVAAGVELADARAGAVATESADRESCRETSTIASIDTGRLDTGQLNTGPLDTPHHTATSRVSHKAK